ncbi:MAG: hypothetical protein KF866_05345 [Phycisphaeraceae bacterium]|nr:hypothetical protein [Phycisphaeraceae bacterium]MCW5754419.1 hypothetical protein [Phycisphaeraceae bacterium]
MFERFFRTYQRRKIININVNVIVAGLLAIAVAKYPVHVVGDWLGDDRKLLRAIAAAAIDGIADIIIYYVLHWVANHWRPLAKKGQRRKENAGSFFKHATLVQFERYMLSPVFYLIAIGLMFTLDKHAGMGHSWAFVCGFITAILVTRVLHTFIGLRTGTFKDAPVTVERTVTPIDEPSQPHTPASPPPSTRSAGHSKVLPPAP